MKNCPYCKSENVEDVILKFRGGQEQRVMFCKNCKKIYRKEVKDEN